MKKCFLMIFLLVFVFSVNAYAEKISDSEIELKFSFGYRTGIYSGEMENGLPHGTGTFKFSAPDGVEWLYEGVFVNGNFQGQGTLTSNSGEKQTGSFHNDRLNGKGTRYINNQISEEGTFVDSNLLNGKRYHYYDGEPGGWDVIKNGNKDNTRMVVFLIVLFGLIVGLPVMGTVLYKYIKRPARVKIKSQDSVTKCPHCGSPNKVAAGKVIECEYCGSPLK